MKGFVKKSFVFVLSLLALSCSNMFNPSCDEKEESSLPDGYIEFKVDTKNDFSRMAVPRAFADGVYYRLKIYKAGDEDNCVYSKYQTTLSFTIPAPAWTGSSVVKLDMYCPTADQLNTDSDGNTVLQKSTSDDSALDPCMTGTQDFNLKANTRVFNHTITLAFAGTEAGTINLFVTVGGTGIKSCIIVPDSAGTDASKYIKAEITPTGYIFVPSVAPFSDHVVFYFFKDSESEYLLDLNEQIKKAALIYSDSITVFARTTTECWLGIDGTEKTVDLEQLQNNTNYVASDGNDTYGGSRFKPLNTVAQALARCQGDGTIYILSKPGDAESSTLTIDKNITIESISSSKITLPTNIEIKDGVKVTISGQSKGIAFSKSSGTATTGISVGENSSLVLDKVEVSGWQNGLVADKACTVDLKNSSAVKGTEYGIKLEHTDGVLKLGGTVVGADKALSSDFDNASLFYKNAKIIRLLTAPDASKTDDVFNDAISSITDFGDGSQLVIGKTSDTSDVTWNLKKGIEIPTGSSGVTHTIKPAKTGRKIKLIRSSSASAKFPLVKSSSIAKWNINDVIFTGGVNTDDNPDVDDDGFGGAFYLNGTSSATVNFTSCNFQKNEAVYGGAIYVAGGPTLNFFNCTIGGSSSTDGNGALKNGGAIYAKSYSTTINIKGTDNTSDPGNLIKYNKCCKSSSIKDSTASNVYGGGAIYLEGNAKCNMQGGKIENNTVQYKVQKAESTDETCAVTGGGSVCVSDSTAEFIFTAGDIANGTIPDATLGQDVYNAGTFRVPESDEWQIYNTLNNAGTKAEVYSSAGLLKPTGTAPYDNDSSVYDNISNGTSSKGYGIDFMTKPSTNTGYIRLNVPSKNAFYSAVELMGQHKGCKLFCGKSTDEDMEYDCGVAPNATPIAPTTLSTPEVCNSNTTFTIGPTAGDSGNKILVKSSLKFKNKGSFYLKNVIFTGTGEKINGSDIESGSYLYLTDTTVKDCSGITVGDGVKLYYEGNSVVGSNDTPILLEGTDSKIYVSSDLTFEDNEDFDGYIGYVKLEDYPSGSSLKQKISGSKYTTYAKYFYILPDDDRNLYGIVNSKVQKKSDDDPKTVMDYLALMPETPTGTDYPQNGDTVACTSQKDLEIIADWVNNNKTLFYKVKVELKNDIDLKGEWTPIGSPNGNYNSKAFTGVFDGQNHTISGLNAKYSTENSKPALFQCIAADIGDNKLENNNGLIKNLTVTGNSEYAGIVGYSIRGIIKDCISEVTVTNGSGSAAGICGINSGEINGCTNKGNVTGTSTVGGIAISGNGASSVPIFNCVNEGEITGTTNVGGIVGSYSSRIIHCKNKGKITARENAGGIAGRFSGYNDSYKRSLYDCWNEGVVKATTTAAGGIIGYLVINGTNKVEIISVVQAGSSIISPGFRGYFYGKTDDGTFIKDGFLFYVEDLGIDVSGTMGSYTHVISDTNLDGEENSDDDYQNDEPINVSNCASMLNIWIGRANVKSWDSKYPIPEWE